MRAPRYLIVNADDFGQSPGVNRGVVVTHEHGIVTSTSLMVRWPAAVEAAGYAREHPELSVGLHLDLGEWFYQSCGWEPLYSVVPPDDIHAVEKEIERQVRAFQRLMGRAPSHLDSHQHIHRREPVRTLMVKLAHRLGVPLRQLSPNVSYCGEFYGQTSMGDPLPEAISADRLIALLAALPPGITEIACHPGQAIEHTTMYRDEREAEVVALCNPDVRAILRAEQIELGSFHGIDGALREV